MRVNSNRKFLDRLGKTLYGEDFATYHWTSVPSQQSNPEEYYRITLYNEFLSQVVAEIIIENPVHSIGILNLLPVECCKHEV